MNFKNKIFCALDFSDLEQTLQFTNKTSADKINWDNTHEND